SVIRALYDALLRQTPTMSVDKLVTAVAPALPGVDEIKVREILDTLMGLAVGRTARDLQPDEFVKALLRSPDAKVEPDRIDAFSSRLIELLTCDSVSITAKAIDLQFENHAILLGSRIVSDVRPVFGDKAAQGAVAGVLVHILKLTVQADGEVRQWFVSLDTADMGRLQKTISRAQEKDGAMRSLVPGVPVLEMGSEDE